MDWNERTLDSNFKPYEKIKNISKCNYIAKYKSQYYCIFWFVVSPFLWYDLKDKRIKQKLVLLLPPLSEKEFEPIFSFLNNHETESSIQENILIIWQAAQISL